MAVVLAVRFGSRFVGFVGRQVTDFVSGVLTATARGGSRRPLMEVVGLKETEHMLAQVTPRIANNIARRVVVRIARDVRDDIRKAAPRDDGTLRKAIVHRRQRGRPGVAEAAVFITHGKGVKHNAFYWHMVEFSTVKTPERPFIRPVVVKFQSRLPQIYHNEFGRQLEKEVSKIARRTVPGLK